MRTEDRLYALAATRKGWGSRDGGEGPQPPSSSETKDDGESTYGGDAAWLTWWIKSPGWTGKAA